MPFSMEHSHRTQDQTLLIHIDGEFRGTHAVEFEKDLLIEIGAGRTKHVVFDLAKVSYVDSAAIEFLFKCAKAAHASGQSIKITHPRENIRKLFTILRVEKLIPIDPA